MEALLMIVVPGLIGGVVMALVFSRMHGRQDVGPRASRLEPPTANFINMANIRVAGVGGLGLVAMATTLAIFMPVIRFAMTTALVLGVGMAIVLIVRRRRTGPLPSGGQHPGAHSMFSIEPTSAADSDEPPSSASRRHALAPIPTL
jgi:hypothetical protein